jgi:hypothetical protein
LTDLFLKVGEPIDRLLEKGLLADLAVGSSDGSLPFRDLEFLQLLGVVGYGLLISSNASVPQTTLSSPSCGIELLFPFGLVLERVLDGLECKSVADLSRLVQSFRSCMVAFAMVLRLVLAEAKIHWRVYVSCKLSWHLCYSLDGIRRGFANSPGVMRPSEIAC